MLIRKLRLQRSWSQEQLAQFSGLSVRTIQRIERGHKPGLESLKSLAAVFEMNISDLQPEAHSMNTEPQASTDTSDSTLNEEEQQAIEQVKELKDFYSHLITYIGAILVLLLINLFTSPDRLWIWSLALGWGIGVILHALSVIELLSWLSPQWEKKQIEKRLGRKL